MKRMIRSNNIKIGDEVYIKTGLLRGQWGIVKLIEGDDYYVGPWNEATSLVFNIDEIEKRDR